MVMQRLLTLLLVVSWIVRSDVALSDERATITFTSSKSILSFFADYALLVNRGIANSPFARSADEWIIERLRSSEAFRKELGVGAEEFAALSNDSRDTEIASIGKSEDEDSEENSSREAVFSGFDFDDKMAARIRLEQNLNDVQQARLAEIYLNIEGYLAIRRPWIRRHIGISKTQLAEIADAATSGIHDHNDGSLKAHGGIFALSNDEAHLIPKVLDELRHKSAALDHQIARCLSADQKERLAEIVCRAINTMDEVNVDRHNYNIKCRLLGSDKD